MRLLLDDRRLADCSTQILRRIRIAIRGQLVVKTGDLNKVFGGWSGVSAVDSARLSDCPTSSIPTAPTNHLIELIAL